MPQASGRTPRIFISYRRDDAACQAGRLYDSLEAHFGVGQVFIDTNLIEPGADFARVIEDALSSCQVFLAVIDPHWLTRCDAAGRRLLDKPKDFVRLETETALRRNIRVIPVLVQGATAPRPGDLPDAVSDLFRRQYLVMSDLSWRQDVSRLIAALVDSDDGNAAHAHAEEPGAARREARAVATRKGEVAGRTQGQMVEAEPRATPRRANSVPKAGDTWVIAAGVLMLTVILAAAVGILISYYRTGRWNGLWQERWDGEAAPASKTRADPLESFVESIGGQVQLEMVAVPDGTFVMGTPANEIGRVNELELQQQSVSVKPFYIGKYEVTQAQWRAVMGEDNNPSRFKGNDSLPVERVSLYDARGFCDKLSQMTKRHHYRLPTEAEWEYAARANTTTPFAFGASLTSDDANFDGNFPYPYGAIPEGKFRRRTTPVGSFDKNKFGLYDMHGNVWEWCEGYAGNPLMPEAKAMVLRGGAWDSPATSLRSGHRVRLHPASRDDSLTHGFRVVADAR